MNSLKLTLIYALGDAVRTSAFTPDSYFLKFSTNKPASFLAAAS